jgi:hypothetical protein
MAKQMKKKAAKANNAGHKTGNKIGHNHTTERRAWTKEDQRSLKTHSKAKTPVAAISKEMARTVGAIRQQAVKLGISLGHRR